MKRLVLLCLLVLLSSCKTIIPTEPVVSQPISDLAGLRADYFALDNFTGPKVTQIDKQVFFDWGSIAPVKSFAPGKFSVRWQAALTIKTSDTYTFYLNHNGQASLKIDGKTVAAGSSLYLSAGQHPLVLEFRKTASTAAIKLEWLKNGQPEILPQALLTPAKVTRQEISMAVTRDVNLLLNPDFSAGSAAWLSYGGQTQVVTPGQDGTGQALGISGWAWVQQDLPVSSIEAGETYTLSGSALASGATCTLGFAGGSVSGTSFRKTLIYRESFYQRQSVSVILPEGTAWMAVYMASTQPQCQFDDLSLVAGVALPPVLPTGEVVLNGSFESDFEGWGRYGGSASITSPGFDSQRALQVSNFAWVQQDFPPDLVQEGEDYFLSARVRSLSGEICTLGLSMTNTANEFFSYKLEFSSREWDFQTLSLVAPLQLSWLAVYLASPAAGCIIDNVSLRLASSLELDTLLQPLLQRNGVTSLAPGPRPAAAKVALGQMLMHDKILSGNKDISCATCHSASLKTGDSLSLSVGTGGQGFGEAREPGPRGYVPRHAPELFNRGVSQWRNFFWDGRLTKMTTGFSAPNVSFPAGVENLLAAQAMSVVLSRIEMRGEVGDLDVNGQANELALIDNPEAVWDALMVRLLSIEAYRTLFAAAYPNIPLDQLGFEHAANAIAAFQIDAFTLLNSPFDRYLAGNRLALSEDAKRGAILFYGQAKCAVCHSGPLLTDQQPRNIGIPQLGPGLSGTDLDLGAFNQSGVTLDRFAFRTPPLRNTAVTGPWMHNGAFTTLEQVIRHYDNAQLSLETYTGEQLEPDLQATVQTSSQVKNDILSTLDGNVAFPLNLTETQISELLSFMQALTDPAVNTLGSKIPASVPSGLPIDR